MISEKVIAEILDYGGRNVVHIISEYIPLKKEGNVFKACCPFHGEKTPSFTVDPGRQSWRCFGSCSEGGNVAKFIMKMEGIKFPVAMQKIASMAGIAMDEDTKEEKERNTMLMVLARANTFFQTTLADQKSAVEYVSSRMTPEMAKQHGIGFAPANGGKSLVNFLTKEKLPLWAAEKAGLVRKDVKDVKDAKDGIEYKDRYWGRMMFPIKNVAGDVIGFGGRAVTGSAKVKYINSPETPLYKKSEVLYGLDVAKDAIREAGKAIVVEGYTDWIQAWNAGVKNVVATCGTAFTRGHATILSRYTKNLMFMLDGDTPGIKALQKAIPTAIDADFTVGVYTLPEGQDPDVYFKAGGKLENIKAQSGLVFLAATGVEMSGTYNKLLRLERLEAGMLWFTANNPEVAAVLAKRGNLHELFDAETTARLTAQFAGRSV